MKRNKTKIKNSECYFRKRLTILKGFLYSTVGSGEGLFTYVIRLPRLCLRPLIFLKSCYIFSENFVSLCVLMLQ